MLEQDARLQAILANAPGSRLIKPGEVIPPQQEDPKEVREHLEGLAMARRDMDMTERIAKAEETKAQANAHFGSGKWKVSMVGYLAAIWFLKRGSPKCPTMVASETRGMDEVASVLGAGTALLTDAAEPEGATPLRIACHLNMAAAALKISEWTIAMAACEYVLGVDAGNLKATFRLAKAEEGGGDLARAVNTCERLLKIDAANVDACRLLESLKKRQDKQKKAFKGVFTRAQAEGDGLYTRAEEARDRAEQAEAARNFPKRPGPTEGTDLVTGGDLMHMTESQRQEFVKQMNEAY